MEKIKRILSYVMIIIMGVFLFSGIKVQKALASETLFKFETDNGYLQYKINDNEEVIIKRYVGKDTNLIIPSEINGKKVTSIESDKEHEDWLDYYYGAFRDCTSLENIEIPEGVVNIGRETFEGCTNLKNIKVNKNNKIYEDRDGVLFDKSGVLIRYPINKKEKKYTIPDYVTEIGNEAFDDCKYLENVEIPNGVISIGEHAFDNCINLKSIIVPEKTLRIGPGAFHGCINLEEVKLPKGVSLGEGRGEYFFNGVFSECSNLKNIQIPERTIIGKYTFFRCYSLEKVVIPEGVREIHYMAFGECTGLKSIVIPKSINYLDNYTFSNCSQDLKIYFKGSEPYFGNYGNYKIILPINIKSFATDKASPQYVGTDVKLIAKAENGEGELQYKFLIKDESGNLKELRDYTTSSTYVWTTKQIGKNTLYVDVKDENGEVVRKSIDYEVKALPTINSFTADKISPQPINTEVTLKTNVSGLIGIAQYKYYKYLDGDYSLIKDWSNNSSITIAPSIAGKYELWVGVKDENEKIVRKNIEFEFKNVLKMNSFTADKASPQPVNTEVTLKTNVSGVTGTAQYKYYKYLNGSYSLIKDWSNNNSTKIAPSIAGKYDLWVGVKDESGKTVRKNIEFEFKKVLAINSFTADKTSPQPVNTEVTLKTNVSGVTGIAQYKYYKYLNGSYSLIKDWSSNSSIKIAPSTAGIYDIYVAVKDDSGKILRKNISFEFKDDFKINSFTISPSSVNSGAITNVTFKWSYSVTSPKNITSIFINDIAVPVSVTSYTASINITSNKIFGFVLK